MGLPPEVPGLVLLAVAAVLAPARPGRLLGAGVIAIAFGTASARVALSLSPVTPLAQTTLLALPLFSRAVDGGLVLAGIAALILALPAALRQVGRTRQWTLVLLMLSGLVIIADAATDLVRSAGWLRPLGTALIVAVLGGALHYLGGRSTWARLSARLRAGLSGGFVGGRPDRAAVLWLGFAVLGVVLAIVSRNALVILAGAAAASLGLHASQRRTGGTGVVPLLPLLVIPLLAFEGHYLRVIAGPVGLGASHFADVPLSSAAQVALAPPLVLAALCFAGPLLMRRWLPGSGLAIVGVALLLRLGHPLLGEALAGWETLFLPLGVVLLWLAALAGDWEASAGTGAWIVATVVAPASAEGAMLLAAAALVIAVRHHIPPARVQVARGLEIVAAAAGAAGLACGVAAVLQHQVVYGLLAALAALVLVVAAGPGRVVIYSAGSPDPTAHTGAAHGFHASSSSI